MQNNPGSCLCVCMCVCVYIHILDGRNALQMNGKLEYQITSKHTTPKENSQIIVTKGCPLVPGWICEHYGLEKQGKVNTVTQRYLRCQVSSTACAPPAWVQSPVIAAIAKAVTSKSKSCTLFLASFSFSNSKACNERFISPHD